MLTADLLAGQTALARRRADILAETRKERDALAKLALQLVLEVRLLGCTDPRHAEEERVLREVLGMWGYEVR